MIIPTLTVSAGKLQKLTAQDKARIANLRTVLDVTYDQHLGNYAAILRNNIILFSDNRSLLDITKKREWEVSHDPNDPNRLYALRVDNPSDTLYRKITHENNRRHFSGEDSVLGVYCNGILYYVSPEKELKFVLDLYED